MLRRLRFVQLLSVLPSIATLGYLCIFVTFAVVQARSVRLLNAIEASYVPAFDVSRDLVELLTTIERDFQDAVAASDVDQLAAIDAQRRDFMTRIDVSAANPIHDRAPLLAIKEKFARYYSLAAQVSREMVTDDSHAATKSGGSLQERTARMMALHGEVKAAVAEMAKKDRQAMQEAMQNTAQVLNASRWMMASIALVCLVLLALFSFYIIRGVTADVVAIEQVAHGLAAGELKQPSLGRDGHNELARLCRAVDDMAVALRNHSQTLHTASTELTVHSKGVAQAMTQLTSAATRQNETISSTTATITEITQLAGIMQDYTRSIAAASQNAVEASQEGRNAVSACDQEICSIQEQSQRISSKAEALRQQVVAIDEIVTAVSEIADQSNILSVNASIEAARVGEAGAGFAAVATAVRDLAQRSKEATDAVQRTLTAVQRGIDDIYNGAHDGARRAETGVTRVRATGEVIEQLSHAIRSAADIAESINKSANEQVKGMTQISTAMCTVDTEGEKNLQATLDIERLAIKMTALADHLQHSMQGTRVNDKGTVTRAS